MKSELQKAADRVRDIQAAIDDYEANRLLCIEGVNEAKAVAFQAQFALNEELRKLADTESLLRAQYEKRSRELREVSSISFEGKDSYPMRIDSENDAPNPF